MSVADNLTPEQYYAKWSMIGAWAQAAIAFVTLMAAVIAAFSWFETLKSQRADECVGSIAALQSAIGKVLFSAKSDVKTKWTDYDEAWQRQSDMAKAFTIERRYSGLKTDCISVFTFILADLERICHNYSESEARNIAARCSEAVDTIVADRRPGALIRAIMWRPKSMRTHG